MNALMPTTSRALDHALATAQSRERLPSVVAGVVRGGDLVWTGARGDVGGSLPGPRTQYRIGSITKTFVAVSVMRLREAGMLDLEDTVGGHLVELAGTPVGELGLGALMAQASGLQAETDGPWWERTPGGDFSGLLPVLGGGAARRHRPGTRYHYSNLGFAVLAEVVARRRGAPWAQVVMQELLGPVGMSDTSLRPRAGAAPGLAVHPWADAVLPEPEHDAGAMAPAGQLWSTVSDLARWARVLAGLEPSVLSPAAAAAMRVAEVVDDPRGPAAGGGGAWTSGYGLGLQLWNEGQGEGQGRAAGASTRRSFGHTGSMPGFVALLRVADPGGWPGTAGVESDGVIVMANSTTGFGGLGMTLMGVLATHEPSFPAPWVPSALDDAVADLVGPWYWGPTPLVLCARGGAGDLELTALAAPGRGGRARSSRFVPRERAGAEGTGAAPTWVGLDGYYAGEVLRVVRSPDGRVSHLDLASFRLTRVPYDPSGQVPGGVDPAGWRG